jgi:hypothetical protein
VTLLEDQDEHLQHLKIDTQRSKVTQVKML